MQTDLIAAFLAEPQRMAQVAAVSPQQNPLLASLWYVFDDGRFWFSSHPTSPLVAAAQRAAPVAVLIDQFAPPDHIRQVRVRGPGMIETHDASRVKRIYERYLGTDQKTWPSFFAERAEDASWVLWSVEPVSGVATTNPEYRAAETRWPSPDANPLQAQN